MRLFKRFAHLFLLFTFLIIGYSSIAQKVSDSLVAKVARRFETEQNFTLQKIIPSAVYKAGQVPEEHIGCYSGKQVMVVAIYSKKPVQPFGRMLVMKRFASSTKFDEHFFQEIEYDKGFKIYYSLLAVYFPQEATFKNCNAVLQVYDKNTVNNKVWLVILAK